MRYRRALALAFAVGMMTTGLITAEPRQTDANAQTGGGQPNAAASGGASNSNDSQTAGSAATTGTPKKHRSHKRSGSVNKGQVTSSEAGGHGSASGSTPSSGNQPSSANDSTSGAVAPH
jgi:hypothetical protein